MAKQKKTEKTTENVPTPVVNINNVEQTSGPSSEPIKYVVIRDNRRVSDVEYDSPTDPVAIGEMQFWRKIIKYWPDGTKAEIVQYDKKKHRNW